MDVVAAPAPTADEAASKPEPKRADHKPPKPEKAPRRRDGNVMAAIFATVIIVLGLAALAVFAYLKQTGKL